MRCFFIRQRAEEQRVQVFYVKASTERLADLLPKAHHTSLTLGVLGHSADLSGIAASIGSSVVVR